MTHSITLTDALTILAIILGPILAVQIEKLLQGRRERKRERLSIFHDLMRTRAARLSPRHVDALNAIDLWFQKDKRVLESWKTYLDHLSTDPGDDKGWTQRADDYLVDLLAEMANVLRYSFDKVQLRRAIYSPRAHGEAEADSILIRRSLADLFSYKRAIPVFVFQSSKPAAAEAKEAENIAAKAAEKPKPADAGR